MFNVNFNRLAEFPENLKKKICIQSSGMDDTLFMTATILLYDRVENLKMIIADGSVEADDRPDVYSFYWYEGAKSPEETLNPIKQKFKSIEKLPTHEKFLSEQLKQEVHLRYMPNENTVCIFVEKLTYSAWHCIPFVMPKMFPVFKQKPLTKEEISFLESLTYKTSMNYTTRIKELVATKGFQSYVLKEQLYAFEKKLFEKKVAAAQNNLNKLEQEMKDAMEVYRKSCEKRVEALALVAGLKTMADSADEHTELQDYLSNNPRICNINISDSKISYIVKTYLAPHHIEEWETMSRNIRMFSRYISSMGYGFNKESDIKILLDAIFSEHRSLKLKMCAYFVIDYFGSEVNSRTRYDYAAQDKTLKDYIPNPHLYYHNCFGQNKPMILEQLQNGDAVGAIACSISCAQRVNIHEGMTFEPFIKDFLNTERKCLVTNDGKELTPHEALDYLKGIKHE